MDIISKNGYLFLGSRLKRLSDRFLTDATKITHALGFKDLYPSQTVLLAALENSPPIAIGDLANDLGLSQPAVTRNLIILRKMGYIVHISAPNDQRQKLIKLSDKGRELVAQLRERMWKNCEATVANLCDREAADLLAQIEKIENALDKKSFEERFMQNIQSLNNANNEIEILEFSDDLAKDFYDINAAWISENFILEEIDKQVLSNPRQKIIETGGAILFAKHKVHGVIGTCALKNCGTAFELTKMGIRIDLRGLKIGETLLVATIAKAKALGIKRLFLLTNAKQKAAIHLYEKLGFVHCQKIMDEFGGGYERCNVAMDYPAISE